MAEQDKEATVYVGNLDERVTDQLVWELMLQAGRIVNVHLPKDRVTQTHQGFGFVEFVSEEDADYAAKIMNQIRLWGKPIRVNKASADKQKTLDVGAELFIGNLDPMVDERVLFETFSRFGSLTSAPKVARDDANLSKGYGFVSFTTFEASDDAIANMHGQYLMNKEITVQYAFKKDGKGERHGDAAERALAAAGREHNIEPQVQPLPPQLMAPQIATPIAPPTPMSAAPYGASPVTGGYGAPPTARTPLAAPPAAAGVPARPPPSVGGYNGPQGFAPPGFAHPPAGMPPGFGPPPGFQPPPGMPGMPPGFAAPPPGMPPNAYQRR
ncbi:RNA-binding domain-containing protein [Aureobasidium pullulans]|uniref:RNA-binding domain-containing protein n=1 Tax=Aureobasidium pullulans TaxID=5580 RepID=A0A4S9TLM8_AURPU|nr:RNA-binding domain-containing protein [Aureobasidium pullulans]THY41601.1 RNA-binding domain-containing protein [Aureobasidium pullulans]THY66356.1 RNA-binding domain-containing protein [Aureobasidium pullulans]THZ25603.1 RNA-binding domain-containing protein [Aureobasidium pullulans]THZ51268.1 RNA-binding domain-containing protein [Aureobasidium pullulans]